MKIQTIIASSILISNLAFGQTPPTPDGKPTFNNIPNFLSGKWNPIYSFPENNQTNFVVSADGTNVKWNSLIYPGGAAGFKLWGQSNATLPFFRITNNPTLTNGWFSVNLTTQSNFFYQLKTQ